MPQPATKKETFTCHHGKGEVDVNTNKCSKRQGKMCPKGFPCKRVK